MENYFGSNQAFLTVQSPSNVVNDKKENRRIRNRKFAKESRERSKLDTERIRNKNADYKEQLLSFAKTLQDILSITHDANIPSNDAVGIIRGQATFALSNSKFLLSMENETEDLSLSEAFENNSSVHIAPTDQPFLTHSSANSSIKIVKSSSSSSDSFLVPIASQNFSAMFGANSMETGDDAINPPL